MTAAVRDYYDVLGLSRSTDAQEIRRAYRRLAHRWHPDHNTAPEASERFKEVTEAYGVLSDPKKQARYDKYGYDWKHAAIVIVPRRNEAQLTGLPEEARSPLKCVLVDTVGEVLDFVFDQAKAKPRTAKGRRSTASSPRTGSASAKQRKAASSK